MGCDSVLAEGFSILCEFQSTHPHGVRPIIAGVTVENQLFQSTHPHGVRHIYYLFHHALKLFQSTHPHGVRRFFRGVRVSIFLFQSTHPHGVRLQRGFVLSSGIYCFNPRTHMGCDPIPLAQFYHQHVSIHAPTWGATKSGAQMPCPLRGFNPRTHMGCD